MPKIYEYLGYIFYFYSNEHTPIHCHIEKSGKGMKAELIYHQKTLSIRFLKVKRAPYFDATEKEELEIFIKERHSEIVQKWESFFILGKKPTFEKIKVKLKKAREIKSKSENDLNKDRE